MNCPSNDTLLRLAEGQLPEDQAQLVRAHVAGCEACRARAEKNRQDEGRFDGPRWPLVLAAGLTVVGAAVAFLPRQGQDGAFQPGGAAWERRVVAKVHTVPAGELTRGDRVDAHAPFFVEVSGLSQTDSLYVIAWVLDASGAARGLATSPLTGATSNGARRIDQLRAMNDLAPGAATAITVVSPAPLSAADLQRLGSPTAEAVRAKYPRAQTRSVNFVVTFTDAGQR